MQHGPERIGPYPIEGELGRGGMGIVYLGRDPALGRPVAIKVLLEEMAADPQRLARFDREARMLAAVHHPNVASIFGVGEDDDGHRYLALEYVPGESLAERLDRSSLPVGEALAVCAQIAAGLEAAHEAGVVHRDLKPGNVRITPDGTAKLLDFGLAKGAATASSITSGTTEAAATTVRHPSTEQGVVLGTIAYMSPEQASGKTVDRRTDVWALGCILFECLAGRRPFAGDTALDTMVKILEREPPWEALPGETPQRVRDLLRRCLEKDRNRRLRDAGDVRLELEAAQGERGSSSEMTVILARPPRRRRAVAAAATAALVAALAAGGAGWWLGRRAATWPAAPIHVTISIPRALHSTGWALAPDGSSVLFWARHRDALAEPSRLYRRSLDSSDVSEIAGTEGIADLAFSPDGRWLYFPRLTGTAPRLMRLPLDGSGPALDLAAWDPAWAGLTVLPDGDVLALTGSNDHVVRISPSSGVASAPRKVDLGDAAWLRHTSGPALPDGRVLFDAGRWSEQGFQVGTLIVDPATGKAQRLLDNGHSARNVADGYLLFARKGVLLGAPFDARAGRMTGEPVPLTGDLFSLGIDASWDVARNGTLAFPPGAKGTADRRLFVVTPGRNDAAPWSRERHEYWTLSPSPDPEVVYAGITNPRNAYEIWKVPREGAGTSLWSDESADLRLPVASPDGRWLAFTRRGGDGRNGVYLLDPRQGGKPRLLRAFAGPGDQLLPLSSLPDSSRLLVTQRREGGNAVLEFDVAAGADAPARVLFEPPTNSAAVSPDGRWIAYAREEGGRDEVYVAPYRRSGSLPPGLRVSRAGGAEPQWSPDGRTLYYAEDSDHVETADGVVAVSIVDGSVAGEARRVADAGDPFGFVYFRQSFAVLPDGRLLFVKRGEDEGGLREIALVLGFGRDLGRRLRK